MKKIFFILFVAVSSALSAQVTVDAKIDSMTLLVGEQARITLEVSADANKKVILPDVRQNAILTGDVMVVEATPVDTTMLNEGKRILLRQEYVVTSFCDHDTGYLIPPFVVTADDEMHLSQELALKIYTIDVDTIHADQFFPPKEIETPALTWDDMKGVVYAGICLLLVAGLMAYLIYRYRKGKPLISIRLKREKKLPPHQVALNEINRIKQDRKWTDEDSKEYYTLLTDALRRYMSERYGFNAMEMTSSEIIERLLQQDDVMLDELRQLFTTADLVKFAKASTLIGENDLNLVNAITYIQQTKVEEDPNAKPEPEPISREEQDFKTQKRLMGIGIAVCIVVISVLLAWMAYRIWDLN